MEHKLQLFQIAFSQLYGIGPIRARRILKLLEHPKDFFELNLNVLQQLTSIPIAQLEKTDRSGALLRAQSQLPFLAKENVSYHFISDASYPDKLKQCPDAPLGLFYRGQELQWQTTRSIAIVGTRQPTNYGKTLVENLLSELPKDILVISGLAKGIDAQVHEQCIHNGLQTIGVLGHGIDRIYPASNRMLAEQMLKNGGLFSEFLIGTTPDRMHFPMRNRIIAGLADAVLVIESNKNGGSLITADLANDYNRDVFAFPGPVFQLQSEGCHDLIKNQQAHLITSAKDLLVAMNWSASVTNRTPNEFSKYSGIQKELIDLFKHRNSWSIDEMALTTKQAVSKISSALFELELNGVLQNKGGNRYGLPL